MSTLQKHKQVCCCAQCSAGETKLMEQIDLDDLAKRLQLRASFAGELWRDGKIRRSECFRIEMDAILGRDTGPVTFEDNTEYQELLRVGWTPKRTQ